MARIRSIKPEFCTSEQVMELSRDARLTFILLWPFCDDRGVHTASLRVVKAELFPADDDVTTARIGEWLDELLRQKLIARFQVDGQEFIAVTGWKAHQRIDKPQPSRYPQPDSEGAIPVLDYFSGEPFPDHSKNAPGAFPESSKNVPGPFPPEGRKEGRKEEGGKDLFRSVGVADATSGDDIGELFERFWSAMPKRGPTASNPKKPARQKFERHVMRGVDPEAIIRGAAEYARQVRSAGKDGTEHVAQAVTFLNQERWTDHGVKATPDPAGSVADETDRLYRELGVQ